ncbi:MAG: HD-GYP domain-containing protein [Chitinispirillaceae bacterium]|nr:HD-GYP domain-containing protein [Chitinispirillaceae bacterium]
MAEIAQKKHLKRISVDQVEVGMYCEDVYNEHDVLILSAHIPIAALDQIALLKNLGVRSVEINLSKGKDVSDSLGIDRKAAEAAARSTLPIEEELPKAKEVYRRTLETARNALKAIRLGQAFPLEQIETVVEEIVGSIMRNPDALVSLSQIRGYDEYTYEHSVNVSILVCSLSHAMGLEKSLIMQGGIGGLLHDIGKTWIPEHIVNKPGKLTDPEYTIMKRHPEYGIEIVKERKGITDLSKMVIIQHHERINGKGYPRGLKVEEIHLMGLIAGVADVYDAMTSNRVYRPAFTPQHSLATIYNSIDVEFPKEISEHFIKLLGVYPVGSFVRLVSGEMGIVTRINRDEMLAPDLLMLFNAAGDRLDRPVECRLAQRQRENDGMHYAIEKSVNPRSYGIDVTEFIKAKISV